MNIYFKGIRIINPTQELDIVSDLWLKDGIIKSMGSSEHEVDVITEIVDGKNLVAAPGFFDMHVHFREPGQEYKEDIESGCKAAANGGFTGVCCMPNTSPVIDNVQVVEFIKNKGRNYLTDVEIAGSITQGRAGKQLSPFLELSDYGVKIFTDDGSCLMDSEVMKRAFQYVTNRDLLISQHCEDHSLTTGFSVNEGVISAKLGLRGYPSVAEEIILSRDIMLAEYCGNRRYHASHISTAGAVRIIRDAKSRGLRVTCEVTPHHFCLDDSIMVKYNTDYKMNPPLRSNGDIEALIIGLQDGTIDCIATDHAPHSLYEKEVEFEKAPNGIIGLETAIGVALTYLYHKELLSLSDIINKLSANPRKILGLKEISIQENEMANITIFAPDEEWIVDKRYLNSKSKNTPFSGYMLKGKPKYVFNNYKSYKSIL